MRERVLSDLCMDVGGRCGGCCRTTAGWFTYRVLLVGFGLPHQCFGSHRDIIWHDCGAPPNITYPKKYWDFISSVWAMLAMVGLGVAIKTALRDNTLRDSLLSGVFGSGANRRGFENADLSERTIG